MPGQTDDEVTIVPLAPDPAAVLPPGLAFSGNVYRFSAEGVGEADIRIPPDGSNPGASAAYVIRVRINRISESHRDLQSQPPPQSRY